MNSVPEKISWELWYQDMFDVTCPRQKVDSGTGLAEGLSRLWVRYLSETIRDNGTTGFSRFNLWLHGLNRSVEISGEGEGSLKLRKWMLENRRLTFTGLHLLERITAVHESLALIGNGSGRILAAAFESDDPAEFETMLGDIHGNWRPR